MQERYLRNREFDTESEGDGAKWRPSSRNFWYFISGFTALYTFGLYKARDSENQLLRIGAAGSLTMLINDVSMYSIESINARQKMVKGENICMRDITKKILATEGLTGLYRGYSASYYSIITHGFCYMYFYKAIK